MDEIIEKSRDKDEKAAYEFAKKIGIESAESDKYVEKIPVFSEMLTDKNSYVGTRVFMLICNQARWADKGQIEVVFNRMKELLMYNQRSHLVCFSGISDGLSSKTFIIFFELHKCVKVMCVCYVVLLPLLLST